MGRKNIVYQQHPDLERYAGMDEHAPGIAGNPALRDAIVQSREVLAKLASRNETARRPSLFSKLAEQAGGLRERFRNKKAAVLLVGSLAIASVTSVLLVSNSGSPENSFGSTGSAVPAHENNSPAQVPVLETEVIDEPDTLNPLIEAEPSETSEGSRQIDIIIPSGSNLWHEVGGILELSGLSDSTCHEIATRGLVNNLREQTGSDLNILPPGVQDFSLTQTDVETQIELARQNPICSASYNS